MVCGGGARSAAVATVATYELSNILVATTSSSKMPPTPRFGHSYRSALFYRYSPKLVHMCVRSRPDTLPSLALYDTYLVIIRGLIPVLHLYHHLSTATLA